MDDRTAPWAMVLKVHAALVPLLDRELQADAGLRSCCMTCCSS